MNSKKPVFRCSGIAALGTTANNGYITETQALEFARLRHLPQITAGQLKKLNDFVARMHISPELGDTGKKAVHDTWLRNEKGFYKLERNTTPTLKGTKAEEDAITLLSMVDDKIYIKNTERKTKEYENFIITGECDIDDEIGDCIQDVKCSIDPETFMNAKLNDNYFAQGQFYCLLWGRKWFRLRYCLVDAPPSVLERMYYYFCKEEGIIDDTLPEYEEQIKRFNNSTLFNNNANYTAEERVKTYTVKRDDAYIEYMLKRLEIGAEYYKKLKLNILL